VIVSGQKSSPVDYKEIVKVALSKIADQSRVLWDLLGFVGEKWSNELANGRELAGNCLKSTSVEMRLFGWCEVRQKSGRKAAEKRQLSVTLHFVICFFPGCQVYAWKLTVNWQKSGSLLPHNHFVLCVLHLWQIAARKLASNWQKTGRSTNFKRSRINWLSLDYNQMHNQSSRIRKLTVKHAPTYIFPSNPKQFTFKTLPINCCLAHVFL